MRLKRSVNAEFLKIFATKTWWILAVVIALYSAMMAGTFAAMFGIMAKELSAEAIPIDNQAFSNMVYSAVASFAYVVPLLLGALAATSEIRHKTLGTAFLAEPKRGYVFASKVFVLLAVGAFLGVVGIVGAVAAGIPILNFFNLDSNIFETETVLLLLRIVGATALWAVIGFGLGLLVKNQAIAIVIALVFTQFLEPTARMGAMFWDWSAKIARFFPGAATDSFVGTSLLNDMSALDPSAPAGGEMLTVWQGGAVLVGIVLLVTVLAWFFRWRKDVQ